MKTEEEIKRTDCWECVHSKFEKDTNYLICKKNLDQSIPVCGIYKTDDDGDFFG